MSPEEHKQRDNRENRMTSQFQPKDDSENEAITKPSKKSHDQEEREKELLRKEN